jgi:hypothetical protein
MLAHGQGLIVGVQSGDHSMAGQRRRVKHTATFEERMAEDARRFREAAKDLPPGSYAQELLLRRARQAETASNINNWLQSPGLRPPQELAEWAKEVSPFGKGERQP